MTNSKRLHDAVEPKEETCPKCGSDTVIITEVKIRRCSKCGYEFVPCPCGKTIRPANSALHYCEYCRTYFGTNDPEKDMVPWEKPQTNFEKWKQGLTERAALYYFLWAGPPPCDKCPAAHQCEAYSKYCQCHSNKNYHEQGGKNCLPTFLAWANAPAKENEE